MIANELEIIDNAKIEDLDQVKIDNYLINVKLKKPNLANLTKEQILKFGGIIIDKKITTLGLLLFGIYPQAYFPQMCIIATLVPGKNIGYVGSENERFVDNKKIEGTIPQMLNEAVDFVIRNIKTKIIIVDGKRRDKTEYPLNAVREAILNSLIHRDYSIHTISSPIRIMMFEDRIEIENPGGLYGRLTIDKLGEVGADTRNPYLVNALEILGITENRFSGIPTIIKEMEDMGLNRPEFISQRGVFKIILYNTPKNEINKRKNEIIKFCKTPKTREEISQFLGFKTSYYVVKNIINPLIKDKTLKLTIPDFPKSKNQKFYS